MSNAFDLPRERIVPVLAHDLAYDPAPHPYESANLAAIDANWAAEKAANPALFDGTIMFFSAIAWRAGQLAARCHPIRFATFLHWRRHFGGGGEHVFAHAMPVTSDGALVAIRMAATTANAGRVYFAAGSFDASDLVDGRIDVDGNMKREVGEETGLDLAAARRDDEVVLWSTPKGTVLARRWFLDRTADEVADAVDAFVAADPEPEIAGSVIIRPGEALPDGMPMHMRPLIEWHFDQQS